MGVRRVGRFPAIDQDIERAAVATMREVAQMQQDHAREIIRAERRIDRGQMVNAVKSGAPERTSFGWRVITAIRPPADDYGTVHETGRRPGAKMPPPAAMKGWVRRVLRVKPKEEDRVAFLVARAIGRRGIKGIRFLRRTGEWIRKQGGDVFRRNLVRERGRR